MLSLESAQLPEDGPGMAMVHMSNGPGGFISWDQIIRRRRHPAQHKRIGESACFRWPSGVKRSCQRQLVLPTSTPGLPSRADAVDGRGRIRRCTRPGYSPARQLTALAPEAGLSEKGRDKVQTMIRAHIIVAFARLESRRGNADAPPACGSDGRASIVQARSFLSEICVQSR
jgi:hypothetical protein